MRINVLKNARSAEYLFDLFYLCSFSSHGGRGAEATVLLVGVQRTPLFGGNKYLNTLRLKLKYLDFSIRVSILPVV